MDRRQLTGILLAMLLIVANVAVWFMLRQPPSRLADSREILRDQRTSQWDAMPAVSFDEFTTTLADRLDSSGPLEASPSAASFDSLLSFDTLARDEKIDLSQAIGGALSAIAANNPRALIAYMADRGLEPSPRKLSELLLKIGGDDQIDKSSPSKQLTAIWKHEGIDPHWGNWIPDATSINVWKPLSMRSVSLVQLGCTESWLWGKDTVYPSMFRSRPTYEQVVLRDPPLLADVRVLIEYDDSLKRERSPHFFRFWYSEKQAKWQPLALKLVRTKSDADASTPKILF